VTIRQGRSKSMKAQVVTDDDDDDGDVFVFTLGNL
jgi:hypothetical protein